MVKICFDYGHGGRDPGAVYKGRKESMDNLDIGMRVAERAGKANLEIGEIRTFDMDLSLKERVDFANRGSYDYFISFHRNAFKPEVANSADNELFDLKRRQIIHEISKAIVLRK